MATSLKKENFPQSVHGLLNKSKTELLNIIARKDDVETRLHTNLDEATHSCKCLQETVDNQAKIIEKYKKSASEADTAVDIANETIAQLKTKNWKLHKDFNYLLIVAVLMFITLVIMVIR